MESPRWAGYAPQDMGPLALGCKGSGLREVDAQRAVESLGPVLVGAQQGRRMVGDHEPRAARVREGCAAQAGDRGLGNPCLVLVNVTTVRDGAECDATCILEAGCHPFVKQESFTVYRSARIEPLAHVARLVKQGFFKPHHSAVDAALLARIRTGLRSSAFTKREFKGLDI